jgi:O-succinylbenzoate synthase
VAHIDAGYKPHQAEDQAGLGHVEPTRAVRDALAGSLCSRWTPTPSTGWSDAAHLAQLDDFNLLLIEQPLAHDDIFDHAKLQPRLRAKPDLPRREHRLAGACPLGHRRWTRAASSTSSPAASAGWPMQSSAFMTWRRRLGMKVWHGGMLETGIGRTTQCGAGQPAQLYVLPGDISANRPLLTSGTLSPIPSTLNADSTLTVLSTRRQRRTGR